MNKKEKVLLLIVVMCFIGLFVKSYFIDGVKDLEDQDKIFKSDVIEAIDQKYNQQIIKYRLIDITTERKEKSIRYTGKIRKYLFGLLPYSDIKIQIDYDLEEIKNEG